MIETIIRDHLTDAGFAAYMEIPEGGGTPPYVVIERTGGGEENQICTATVAIQCYGGSLYAAALLCAQVKDTMDAITERPEVSACELNSAYNFTDPTKKQYRYQAVYSLVYYD